MGEEYSLQGLLAAITRPVELDVYSQETGKLLRGKVELSPEFGMVRVRFARADVGYLMALGPGPYWYTVSLECTGFEVLVHVSDLIRLMGGYQNG